jgi:exodeoxyribonuclease X
MLAIVVDTESTGFRNPEIIELGWAIVDFDNGRFSKRKNGSQLYEPKGEIEPGAAAVHGIVAEDLVGCWPSEEAVNAFARVLNKYRPSYLIGHNVDHDWKLLQTPNVKRICTLAFSRELWPTCESHKLKALTYWLNGVTSETRKMVEGAHRASSDVDMTIYVAGEVARTMATTSLKKLHYDSEVARVPTRMTFGEHRGKPIKNLPKGYKNWLLTKTDLDDYLRLALERVK